MEQEDMTSARQERSEGESDVEAQHHNKSSGTSRSKETAAGRAEQRRTRKREKVSTPN